MISIAIDGPSSAGKSTIARAVAKELGYTYVDTGALYRTIALYFLRNQVDPADGARVKKALSEIQVEIRYLYGEQHAILNGEDVSGDIRGDKISQMASAVSTVKQVRDFLLDVQRQMALKDNVVMDGRDIGTVVLPNAQIKIFLTASAAQRAKRRHEEYAAKGIDSNYDDILASIMERDLRDSTRAIAPLKQAEDAELIDTTYNTLEESVKEITAYIRARLEKLEAAQ